MSVLALATPAWAQQTPHALCNGVLNQLEERGTVNPRLLEAAAKQNAGLILQLRQEQNTLEADRTTLQAQIAGAEADLDEALAHKADREEQLASSKAELGILLDQRNSLRARIQELRQRLANTQDPLRKKQLRQKIQERRGQLEQVNAEISQVQSRIQQLNGQLQEADSSIAELEANIEQLRGELEQATASISELEAFLQQADEQLRQIDDRIARIQRQIELGGCSPA